MKRPICLLLALIMSLCCMGCVIEEDSSAAFSSILPSIYSAVSTQHKYVLSDENAAKIESYSKLPESDEEIIAEYHYQFDLYDYLKSSLSERGYTQEQIAQIDKQDFIALEKNWPINPNNPGGRTFADLEEEARENEAKFLKERAPTPEQQARLDKLGIDDELLLKLLTKEYFDRVENLLEQPEERIIELRDLYKGNILLAEAFENRRQRIRARYFEITGKKPFVDAG